MLAKVAPASNDFTALARYLVHGKPGTKPSPNRVAWTCTQNLPSDVPELAATCMQATAAASRRTRKAAYHLMISWHANERPSPELMQTIARETLERAGLAEHQALIMGHGDRAHPHLHILLNRVHPDTGRAWKTTHDFARFDRIMRELAETHGCAYVPAHLYNPELTDEHASKPDSNATYAAKRGAPTNRVQWSRRTSREVGDRLSDELTHTSTSLDVDELLEEHGLTLQPKGRGFVVGNGQSYSKLSRLALTKSAYSKLFARAQLLLVPARSQPHVLTPDGVDIARALRGIGLADDDDIANAIADAHAQRLEQAMTRKANASTLFTPTLHEKVKPRHRVPASSFAHAPPAITPRPPPRILRRPTPPAKPPSAR